jgi:MORN repeat variant
MPKLRIQRFYYRNGQTRVENREVNGAYHGSCRTWHYNGQMAQERRYSHDQLHGHSRQWNAKGRLLGSFTMNHGTGILRHWHENGRLHLEIDLTDGQYHGRTRMWLRDGTLVMENYYIHHRDTTRAAYLKAARNHPDWPQYQAQSAGRVAREGTALKRREHELFMESLLAKAHAEARQWLSAAPRPHLRSLARFRTAKAALRFVETIYAAGAKTVIVVPIYAGKRGKQFADALLVKLPPTPSKRKALRKLGRDFCAKRGGAMLPDEKDLGESHLFINLE